jgi:hypothetical protein
MSGRGSGSSYAETTMLKSEKAGAWVSSAPAHPGRLAAICQFRPAFRAYQLTAEHEQSINTRAREAFATTPLRGRNPT